MSTEMATATQAAVVRTITLDRRMRRLDRCIRYELATSNLANWRFAKALAQFHDAQGWLVIGYFSAQDYQRAIGISRSKYYRTLQAYRVFSFVPEKVMGTLDASKVELAAQAVERGIVTTKDALQDAAQIGHHGLRVKYGLVRTPVSAPPIVKACPDLRALIDVLIGLLGDPTVSDGDAREWALKMCEPALVGRD